MKFITTVLPIFVFCLFLFSCSTTNTETFEANFTGEYVNIITGDDLVDCDEEFECRVIVEVEGEATQIGNFTGQFSFCACGPEGKYSPSESYFVSEGGDSLFFSCQGNVIEGRLDEHPEYVISYWKDSFVFKGGTGRFAGATGSGTTDDYNSSLDPNSHHNWKGKLILKK